jgi:ADP-heptose:LPS heptosyltransferase
MSKRVFRIVSWGGIGDVLLSTPIFSTLKRRYPDCKIRVFCRRRSDMEVYRNNPFIDEMRGSSFLLSPISFISYRFNWKAFYTYNYGALYPGLNYKKSAIEIIAEMAGLETVGKSVQLFLTLREEDEAKCLLARYKNPIALHVTPACSRNKEWPLQNWEELVKRMPDYSFVQLGLASEPMVRGAIDIRGKTTFRSASAIIKNALSFVGVDSSFSHVTNAFNVPGVVLFGPSTPEVWGHSNNINLYKRVRCAPCIDLLLRSTCPYDQRCMRDISIEEVKAALLQQLSKKLQ